MKRALIIGAGIAGATAARVLVEYGGYEVTVLEKNSYVGGACHDHLDEKHKLVFYLLMILFYKIHKISNFYLILIKHAQALFVDQILHLKINLILVDENSLLPEFQQ